MQRKVTSATYTIFNLDGTALSSGECEVIDEREPGSYCFGDVVLNATGSVERPLTRSEDAGSATESGGSGSAGTTYSSESEYYAHVNSRCFVEFNIPGFAEAMSSLADFMKSQSARDSFYDLLELKPDPPAPISETAKEPIIPIQAKEARGPPIELIENINLRRPCAGVFYEMS